MSKEQFEVTYEKATACLEKAEEIQEQCRREGREANEKERAAMERNLQDAQDLKAQGDREKIQFMTGATQHLLRETPTPGPEPDDLSLTDHHGPRRTPTRRPTSGAGRGGRRYREMFRVSGQANGGFSGFEDYLQTVHSGLNDSRLIRAAMGGASGSGGGFLVPTEFAAQMLDASLEDEIVRPRADLAPMISDTKRVAGWDVSDNSSGELYGGFSGEWLSEGEAATEVDAKVRMITLTAKKLAIYTSASNELVADGMSFEQMLGQALVKSIGWHLDYSFLNGTGSGQPLGVLNDPALVTVAAESGQAADSIVPANVCKMFARLHPQSVNNAVWVGSSTIIPTLYQMQNKIRNDADSDSVGGSQFFMPTGGDRPSGTLLGLPILFTEKLPVVGDVGDLLLCDFSQYVVGLRAEVVLEKSVDAGWSQDLSSYRVKVRADGQGKWSAAFTPRNGDTLSWCVALAARA